MKEDNQYDLVHPEYTFQDSTTVGQLVMLC